MNSKTNNAVCVVVGLAGCVFLAMGGTDFHIGIGIILIGQSLIGMRQ